MMLSPARLAERWDTTRQTVYRWIEDGEVPAERIGGLLRISGDFVEAVEKRWREKQEASGSNSAAASGAPAGPNVVLMAGAGSSPEAAARAMKARRSSG